MNGCRNMRHINTTMVVSLGLSVSYFYQSHLILLIVNHQLKIIPTFQKINLGRVLPVTSHAAIINQVRVEGSIWTQQKCCIKKAIQIQAWWRGIRGAGYAKMEMHKAFEEDVTGITGLRFLGWGSAQLMVEGNVGTWERCGCHIWYIHLTHATLEDVFAWHCARARWSMQ